ncbi:MAG: hypothetical protein H7Y07_10910 [Pyrinomonadaceae bacterium]|nr:hypothetical protein [Sphingobacteriaceae bacterium]
MKNLFTLLLASSLFLSCASNKEDDPEPEVNTATSGKITYKVDGKSVTYNGSGYLMGNDYSFIKWENVKEQLSIDFYGMDAKSYTVTNAAKASGNAKIYYYPDIIGNSNLMYISKSGTFTVTSYSKTSGFMASGTFSATLEKSLNGTFTGEKIEITEGSFKDIVLADIR